MTSVLETVGLTVRYGNVSALNGVDIAVEPGQLVGLIGPNGAGKTTFIDAVGGFAASTGQVLLNGQDVSRLSPHARARLGFARTWQTVELFDDLTVRENLAVSAARPSPWQTAKEILTGRARHSGRADEVLDLMGIAHLADRPTDQLTQTRDRKLVGIARAMMSSPHVICLDEPAAGLDTTESERFGRHLQRLRSETGVAVLLVDHDMGLVLSICDQVVVLEFGQAIAAGPPERVKSDARVIAAYLGSQGARAVPDAETSTR